MMKTKNVTLFTISLITIILCGLGGYYYYQSAPMRQQSPSVVVITLKIDFAGLLPSESASISVPTNQSHFEIMNATYQLDYQTYVGMGHLITGINGVLQDINISGYYWRFYINGELSQVGADAVHHAEGDSVLWRYEPL